MKARKRAVKKKGLSSSEAPISLSDTAYQTIKRKIITLEYRPGQYLNEVQVCKSLGIGRTPVYHALHRLMVEGLVEIIPRKGVIVLPNSLNEVLALLEARWLIEPYCAGLVVSRANPQDVEILKEILERAQNAAQKAQTEKFMELDVLFHGTLARIAGNPILEDMLKGLHDRAARIWYLHVWQKSDMLLTHDEHYAVFDGIACGNKEAAMTAMQQHLTSLRRRILQGAN